MECKCGNNMKTIVLEQAGAEIENKKAYWCAECGRFLSTDRKWSTPDITRSTETPGPVTVGFTLEEGADDTLNRVRLVAKALEYEFSPYLNVLPEAVLAGQRAAIAWAQAVYGEGR